MILGHNSDNNNNDNRYSDSDSTSNSNSNSNSTSNSTNRKKIIVIRTIVLSACNIPLQADLHQGCNCRLPMLRTPL